MEQDYRPSKDLRDSVVVISSTTTSAGNGGGTTLIDTALTQANDYWINMAVVILSGNSIGQIRRISVFTLASNTLTVDTAFASQISSGTKYNIVAQYTPASGSGDATLANQVLILADTNKIDSASLAVSPTAGSLARFIASGGTALGTQLPDSKSLYDCLSGGVSAVNTSVGRRQVFEKTITAAANSGSNTIGTVSTQSCVIESIIIHANAAQTANLTSCAVTGATGVITFIDAGVAIQSNLDATDKQLWWTGAVRLAATKTIVTNLVGAASTAVNLTFIVTYYSSSANGGTIS
jgi:hypothetical protein